MAADPAQEDLTHDFGLQLVLEAHRQAASKPMEADHTKIIEELYGQMLPREVVLPQAAPQAQRIVSDGEYEGRKLLSSTLSGADLTFSLERNYRAFCNAAQHYLYYVSPAGTPPSDGEADQAITLAIASRFPWLIAGLPPGLHWESTAYSFAMYA